MKIAIPVKTNRENPAVAPLFGKAKWFAFVEDGEVSIEKNEAEGGVRVVDWLIDKGVTSLIIQHMGSSPYEIIKLDGQITVFYAGNERIDVKTVMKRYEDETLTIIDDTNESEIVKNH
jgi:predicted Fe-Mo cluster-binding NifX family protein